MQQDVADRYLVLHEFIRQARENLDDAGWDYLVGGAETETTVRRNRYAIERLALRPRVLNDVSAISATRKLFAKTLRLPIILAPVGGLETFDEGAALSVAGAAGQFGVPMMLSSVSRNTMEDVRGQTGNVAIYQLYVRGDADWVDGQVERAIAAGYDAFCLTVDTAMYSRRERDIEKRFHKPWRSKVDAHAVRCQAALSWDDVARIRKQYDIPLILKGIATGEDTRIAVGHGVDIVYVSNHGGRQLDCGIGSLDVLPEVLDAANGDVPVFIDGGFSRGTDIVKAIALGAEAVGIGRLYCYAMAAAGAPGIARMLEILEDEIVGALGLLGVTNLDALTRAHVHTGAPGPRDPHVMSAFPLLKLDEPG